MKLPFNDKKFLFLLFAITCSCGELTYNGEVDKKNLIVEKINDFKIYGRILGSFWFIIMNFFHSQVLSPAKLKKVIQ